MGQTVPWNGYGKTKPEPRAGSYRDRKRRAGADDPPPEPSAAANAQSGHAPGGRDPKYWHLALYFQDKAAKDHITLRVGVPVIYDEIRRVFTDLDVEGGSRIYEDSTPYRKVYRDASGKGVPWEKVAEAVIDEFWGYYWNQDALRYFCDYDRLDDLFRAVCRRWQHGRLKAAIAAGPPPDTSPIKWNPEGRRRRKKKSAGV